MGLFDKTVPESTKREIVFVIETAIKMLKKSVDGGYIKAFYKGGIDVLFGESYFSEKREDDLWRYKLSSEVEEQWLRLTKRSINKQWSDHTADLMVTYDYPDKISKNVISEIFNDAVKGECPELYSNISYQKEGISLVVMDD